MNPAAPASHRWVSSLSSWVIGRYYAWHLNSPRALLIGWFGLRLLVFLTWAVFSPSTQGDVLYYYDNTNAMLRGGDPALTMREYPTPVLWLLTIPWLFGFGTATGYVVAFVMLMLALDAAFSWSLWHTAGRLRSQSLWFWSVFVTMCGPAVYLRFDLVTSVLAGGAILFALRRRPAIAGALAGAGAAIKLWPALLWPALCGGSRKAARKATLGFWATGGALALASLLWAGWPRLLSPLSWQSGRGLQVESVWATVPMLMRAFGLGDYAVAISRFQAFEVYGTGVAFWLNCASIAFLVGLVAIVVAYGLFVWRGHGNLMEAFALTLLVILLMIVTNKTFSPQYIIWTGAPMAAAFAVMGSRTPGGASYDLDRYRMWASSMLLLLTSALTVLVYPIGYPPLVRDIPSAHWFRLPVTLILAARNVTILILFVLVVRWIASFLGPWLWQRVRRQKNDSKDSPAQ